MRQIDQHFRETWGEFDQDPREFIDSGDNLVIAVIAMRGRGVASGAPLDSEAVWVDELRDGQLARCRAFTTKAQALEAAGLSEYDEIAVGSGAGAGALVNRLAPFGKKILPLERLRT